MEALRAWADREDLWVVPEQLGEFRRGRREHDLFRRSDLLGIVFKITRGAGFGLFPSPFNVVSGMVSDWFGMLPATPTQYFGRLVLGNLLYPGLNALEGFCEWEGRFAIVTSQPFIAGRNATDREIRDFLGLRRFLPLCEATWFRPGDNLAIFDVGGSNLLVSETGDLVPIDVIPVAATGALLDRLREAHRRIAR